MTDSFKYENFNFGGKDDVIFALEKRITCSEEARPYIRAGFVFYFYFVLVLFCFVLFYLVSHVIIDLALFLIIVMKRQSQLSLRPQKLIQAVPCKKNKKQTNKKAFIDCFLPRAYWGIAYAIGLHYNWPPGLGSGFDAIQKAVELKNHASDLERLGFNGHFFFSFSFFFLVVLPYNNILRALIDALSVRSSKEGRDTVDPSKLFFGTTPDMNEKFAEKMEGVYNNYSDSLDVCALYAESLMMLNPWKLWVSSIL